MAAEIDPQRYWETRLAENFNERGVGDIGLSESYNQYLYSVRKIVFQRALKLSHVKCVSAKVIDIGSGTGFYIKNWLDAGVQDLAGADITQVAVDQLTVRYPGVTFQRIDIGDSNISLPRHEFDVVSSFDVLFHIIDNARFMAALCNISSLLKPGGVFLYSDNLVGQAFNVRHQVGRTEETILNSLDQAGLIVEHRIPMFVLMNDPVRSNSRVLKKAFSIVYRLASASPLMGGLVGAVLYPLELFLTRVISRGPSTEVLVCRRRSAL